VEGTDKVIIALGFFTVIGLIVYFVFLSNGGTLIPARTTSGSEWVTVSDLKKEMRSNG
jgi:hypothetical protein